MSNDRAHRLSGLSKRVCVAPALLCICLFLLSCETYYERTASFQQAFVSGDFVRADLALGVPDNQANPGLLYLLQKATVLHMLDDMASSNVFFEDAYRFAEDNRTNYSAEAAALLTNPQAAPNKGEDFEVVAINYYKALNFLALGDLESALVECRRLNIALNRINDRYAKFKNRYRVDATALLIMGLIYEAAHEYNDAFIAYRNALNAYREVYAKNFGIGPPEQLKSDLLRMAYVIGFDDELHKYETEFGRKYVHNEDPGGDFVVLWHTGLGPVKDEWSVNFVVVRGEGNTVLFVNEGLGLKFPFAVSSSGGTSVKSLGGVRFVRVAFPRYRERKPYYTGSTLQISSGMRIQLETIQDVNAIALATLSDRMNREMATALLRLALKQASEQAVRQVDANLGALLSIVNSVSERADTRNWQTLPFAIQYARIRLPAGEHTVEFTRHGRSTVKPVSETWFANISADETTFRIEHSIETYPLGD